MLGGVEVAEFKKKTERKKGGGGERHTERERERQRERDRERERERGISPRLDLGLASVRQSGVYSHYTTEQLQDKNTEWGNTVVSLQVSPSLYLTERLVHSLATLINLQRRCIN